LNKSKNPSNFVETGQGGGSKPLFNEGEKYSNPFLNLLVLLYFLLAVLGKLNQKKEIKKLSFDLSFQKNENKRI
jgi:hypothetical protein